MDCQGFGGDWFFSKTCGEIDCMPQTGNGACCLEGAGCVVGGTAFCESLNGLYLEGEPCQGQCPSEPLGACCFNDDVCGMAMADECPNNATYLGVGTQCKPDTCLPADAGACCVDNNCFANWSEAKCVGFGGEHKGAGTGCEVCK